MNSEIRFLQQLEEDLDEAARHLPRRGADHGGRGAGTRRGRYWGQIAAAVVALLVLAGSIGFLAQNGGPSGEAGDVALRAGEQEAPAEAPAPETTPVFETDDERVRANDSAAEFRVTAQADGGGSARGNASGPVSSIGQVPNAQQDLTKIVRDGRIDVQLANGSFARNVGAVSRIARNNGGFVLTSSTREGRAGTFTLRIPAKRFDAAMDQLRELGEVQTDTITGEDVTAEFIDLQARLEILTDRRALLRDLQADATTSREILRFAGLIDDAQLQIEKIQGNLRFLKDQVAEATIEVSLHEEDAPEGNPDVDKPRLSQALDYAVQGFLRVVVAVVVGLGYLVPIVVLAGVAWGIWILVRRRRQGPSEG